MEEKRCNEAFLLLYVPTKQNKSVAFLLLQTTASGKLLETVPNASATAVPLPRIAPYLPAYFTSPENGNPKPYPQIHLSDPIATSCHSLPVLTPRLYIHICKTIPNILNLYSPSKYFSGQMNNQYKRSALPVSVDLIQSYVDHVIAQNEALKPLSKRKAFQLTTHPKLSPADYISRTNAFLPSLRSLFIHALILMHRLERGGKSPVYIDSGSVYKMWIACLFIAQRANCRKYTSMPSSRTLCFVAKIPFGEMLVIQQHASDLLQHDVLVTADQYKSFVHHMVDTVWKEKKSVWQSFSTEAALVAQLLPQ